MPTLSAIISSKWLWIVLSAAVLVIAALLYFNWSQESISDLNKRVARQEETLAIQQNTIKQLTDRMKVVEQASRDFDKAVMDIRSQTASLAKTFTKKELLQKSVSDPTDTEQQINDLTNKLFIDLENITKGDKQ